MAIDREKVIAAAQKFVEKKKYDKAVAEYEKITAEDPNDARTLLKIGDLRSKMEAYPDAIVTYERVGKFYATQGFALKAIAVYKQIRELISKHAPQLEDKYGHIAPKLAELYQQLGLTSDALAALDEVATRLQRQNKDNEAIDVFRKIVDLDPTNPLPHLRLAEALSRIQDTDAAVAEFGLAASQLVKLGRRDDALKVIERLLHHKPDAAHARIAAELYLARSGQNDGMQALAKLQICFQANPKDLDTLALLARAFAAIGQAAKGIEVQKEMAKIAREQGKTDLFKQIVERLLKAAPNDEGVRALAQQASPQAQPVLQQPQTQPAPLPTSRQEQQQQQRAASTRPDQRVPEQARRAAPVEDLEYEEVVETGDVQDVDEPEPFPLRSDRPPPGRHESSAPELMVGDDDLEAAEELPSGELPEVDSAEQIAQVLADAASFRRVRLFPKAIETLRIGLELEPRSLDLRETLRDVLLEASRVNEAVDEMLILASLYVDSLDGDAAARCLQDVLAYDPPNARARQMLHELGYEVIDEPQDEAPAELETSEPDQMSAGQPGRGGYAYDDGFEAANDAPLPAYDLDEVAPAETNARAYGRSSTRSSGPPGRTAPHGRAPIGEIDDPFGSAEPLPSFPLDQGPESAAAFDLVDRREDELLEEEEQHPDSLALADAQEPGGFALDEPDDDLAGTSARPSLPPIARQPSVPPVATPELEEALEEAEFFTSRGLYDDARAILNEQLARLPNHPLLRERLGEIDAQEQTSKRGSGAREMPKKEVTDRAFDIAASLDALEAGDRERAGGPSPAFAETQQQVDVEEVFAKFKEGVAKQISVDDAQSHYDLGVAYKEMGLLDDAVREFDTAARDPKRECVCRSMIGMIQVERGNVNEAIDAFMRGLRAKARLPEQEMVLEFEVAACYEAKRMAQKALEFYLKVLKRDPSYRDVQDRVRRLKGEKSQIRQAAVGADEDFDRAFDDLLGGKP